MKRTLLSVRPDPRVDSKPWMLRDASLDFEKRFPDGSVYNEQRIDQGHIELMLPAGWNRDELPQDFNDWFNGYIRGGWQYNYRVIAGPRPWSMIAGMRNVKSHYPMPIYLDPEKNWHLSPRPLYVASHNSTSGYYQRDDGGIGVACQFWHPGLMMVITHHVCNLTPQTDILDCLDISHDD